VVICLERGADLHMAQLMPLSLTVLSSVKSRSVLPFWPAHPGSPGQKAVKRVCVYVKYTDHRHARTCLRMPHKSALPRGYWMRAPSNTWFPPSAPRRVHSPNGNLIGSGVFARLTDVSNAHRPRKIGDSRTHRMHSDAA